MRRHLSEQAAQAVLETQAAQRPVPGPLCPTCQRERHYKATKAQAVESRAGHLRIARGYDYCETCRPWFFFLDEQRELWEHPWSESVLKYAVG